MSDGDLKQKVIAFDVLIPDPEDPDGSPLNRDNYLSTTERSTIVSGLLRMAELYMSSSVPSEEDDDA